MGTEELQDFFEYYNMIDHYISEQTAGQIIVITVILTFILSLILEKFTNRNKSMGISILAMFFIFYGCCKIYGSYCDKIYSEALYNYYSEYQPYIENVVDTSISYEKPSYLLMINRKNTKTTIRLDRKIAEFEKKKSENETSYYEIYQDQINKKIKLIKYVAVKKQETNQQEKNQIKKIIIE